jgi:hypothetical protein
MLMGHVAFRRTMILERKRKEKERKLLRKKLLGDAYDEAAEKEREQQKGYRDTVLSLQEAIASMSQRRTTSRQQQNSCDLFGQGSNNSAVEKVLTISSGKIDVVCKPKAQQLRHQTPTTIIKREVVIKFAPPEEETTNSNTRRPVQPVNHSFVKSFQRRKFSHGDDVTIVENHHRIVVVDETVKLQEIERASSANAAAASPRQANREHSASANGVRRKNGAASSAMKMPTGSRSFLPNGSAKTLCEQQKSGLMIPRQPPQTDSAAAAADGISIRKSEIHQKTNMKNFWAEEEVADGCRGEAPEPFGFNVGFPAIWRVVAGNKIGKSLSADVKHYV